MRQDEATAAKPIWVPPGPAGELTMLPQTPSWIKRSRSGRKDGKWESIKLGKEKRRGEGKGIFALSLIKHWLCNIMFLGISVMITDIRR